MKSTNLKRFGAAALSGAMALSMAAPAFAADPPDATSAITINGTYQPITLNVILSNQTGAARINPYGLPFDLTHQETGDSGTDTVIDGTISGQQVTTTTPLYIANGSAVALSVTAEVNGTVAGDDNHVVLIEDATAVNTAAEGTVSKNIAAKFEAFSAPATFEGDDTTWEKAEVNAVFAALESKDAALTAPILPADDNGNGKTTTGKLVLREGDDEHLPQAGSVAFFRLSGSVAKKPTEAWGTDDKFDTTIVFTFEPSEYVGTATLSGAESVAAGSTAKLTVAGLPDGVKVQYNTIKWTSSKETYVTVADGTKKPTGEITDLTMVEANTLTGTVTGVKSGSTKSAIAVEFVGSDGITYRASTEVKCG